MYTSITLKAILLMGIVCLMSKGQVSCRHLSEDTIAQSEANQEFLAADEPTKSNLLKYLLNAYHRVAAENDRLKEEYAQLGSVVKFLTEGKDGGDGRESNKRAMKNIALGFGKK